MTLSPRHLRITLVAGLSIKALLFLWAYMTTSATPLLLMQGHDGAEYLRFAQVLATPHSILPADVARHDPGLAAAIATLWLASFKIVSLPAIAMILQAASWIASTVLLFQILRRVAPSATPPIFFAAALAYPATLYYGQFNLTEPPFLALLLASILASLSRRFLLAAFLAGLASMVRSTGLLLVLSLLVTHPAFIEALTLPRWSTLKKALIALLPMALLGILPWIGAQALIHQKFGITISSHKPTFGLPFSGFQDLAQAGTARSVYILSVVGFFILSTGLLIHQTLRYRSFPPLIPTFAALFLVFHLCLKTLYYIDTTVYTFDYQDRYLAPIWPLALLAWHRHIRWPVALAAATVAMVLSAWWLKNYIPASALLP